MYRPKHRAPIRRRPTFKSASVASVGALGLAAAAVLGPSAYADTHSPFTHHVATPSHHPTKPSKPTKPGKPGDDDANDANGAHDPTATNGGKPLPGDAGLSLADLKPTAPPLTAYEMPFPCGETWGGSSRPGHSPSVRAVDFNYPGGDLGKPVVAAAAGTVVTAVVGRNKPSYGQYVVIDHGNGESTLYGHLDSELVTVGQVVQAGTQLGTVGETGNASGPHLHFEERVGGAVVDAWFHGAPFPMGSAQASQNCGEVAVSTDIPLAGDMYGARSAEVMVFRKASPVAFHITRLGTKERVIRLGSPSDQPVLGDWDGDGRVNPGVRDPSTRLFTMQVKRTKATVKFGKRGDLPIAGNWDGTGTWEVGVRRPTSAKFLLRMPDGSVKRIALGDANDLPVTGDWDGNGVTDLGVYDQTTAVFTLLQTDPLGTPFTTQIPFGSPGDVPVTGDWDGNGITDLGVWSPLTATFNKRGAVAPTGSTGRIKHLRFGRAAVR